MVGPETFAPPLAMPFVWRKGPLRHPPVDPRYVAAVMIATSLLPLTMPTTLVWYVMSIVVIAYR